MKNVVREVAPATETQLLRAWERIDFSDAFSIELESEGEIELSAFIVALFTGLPRWVRWALICRDRVVGVFGLKTGQEPRKELEDYRGEMGQRIAVFETWERRGDDEVVMGCNDKHLDFLCSFRRELPQAGRYVFTFETYVQLKGLFGRAYFSLVRVAHPFVVKAMLRGAGQAIDLRRQTGDRGCRVAMPRG